MSDTHFNVTYERITEESAAEGDAEERGFVGTELSLRAALTLIEQTAHNVETIEPSDSHIDSARWFTWFCGPDYISGDVTNVSLHLPDSATPSSRKRIAHFIGVH